ncbi:MAG: hypothetical protein IT285_02515 [Bdellovibrionales bacterium]|nr:hypothetical protein [Bdellovibrionales bacterium]
MNALLDLRGVSRTEINEAVLSDRPTAEGPGLALLSAYQTQWLDLDVAEARQYLAVVPDFVQYARLLSSGRFQEFLDLGGARFDSMRALVMAGLRSAPSALGLARLEFWAVARLLLLHDLSMLSGWFKGRAVLHPYLTDLAVAAGAHEFLADWGTLKSASLLGCRRGIWTRHAPYTLSALAAGRVKAEVLLYRDAPGAVAGRLAVESARADSHFRDTEFIPVP